MKIPFKVSADYIDWAHGPGAESGQKLATELCELPIKNKQTIVPNNRPDLVKEIASVAELYVGHGETEPRAARVLNKARKWLNER